MRYMLLLYDRETEYQEEELPLWIKYTEKMESAGAMLGGEALQPTETATTVRGADPEPLVTDGPFAEAKEQLGGYYVIEAKDLDEALAWARQAPHVARGGSVEVRPIFEME